LSKFAPIIGSLGLVVDLAFHWAATADPSSVPAVMTTLLADTDLAQDAWWLTLLGVSAHLMFLVAFLYLLVGSWDSGARGRRRRLKVTRASASPRRGPCKSAANGSPVRKR
jgi:hypothetical protein